MVNIPSLPLKIVFFTHLVLIALALQGYWLPLSYTFYNAFFLVTLLWAVHHRESDEPIFMGLAINAISIVLDIIVMSSTYPNSGGGPRQFSLAFTIMNLIARLFSCAVLYRVMNERGGNYNDFGVPNIGNYFGGSGAARGPYENIDQPMPQSVPQNNVDFDSPHPKPPYRTDVGHLGN